MAALPYGSAAPAFPFAARVNMAIWRGEAPAAVHAEPSSEFRVQPFHPFDRLFDAIGIEDRELAVAVGVDGHVSGIAIQMARIACRAFHPGVVHRGAEATVYFDIEIHAGFATTAGRAGVPERIIMLQTGHKSLPVLRGYIRRGSLFTENAAAMIGM